MTFAASFRHTNALVAPVWLHKYVTLAQVSAGFFISIDTTHTQATCACACDTSLTPATPLNRL
ncbi:hypothetical protein [Streptomyces anulatus]|uniref:hypothetical protein n=1 Tax=Streptomyces anulatus TaxID=1892 RepID=UPI003435D214